MKWFEMINSISEIDSLMAHTPHSPAERIQRNDFVKEQLNEIVKICYEINDELTRENDEINQIESMPKTARKYVQNPMNEEEWE